ncbi:MAG: formylglycine-generating enzyme family protein, partial [Chromatiaceae bacterium]|nr:formylglycine-generating enzyme family protein [Chromatiaceae bacterium]
GVDSSGWSEMQCSNPKSGSHPVGAKPANPRGLHDMIGNVWEWCADGFRYYDEAWKVDPEGPLDAGADRVFRGGSWVDYARDCRRARRSRVRPVDRLGNLGFRCARAQV